ncbi:MAG: hypothetical protein ABMA26_05370 [Limisphaerales bacterium]
MNRTLASPPPAGPLLTRSDILDLRALAGKLVHGDDAVSAHLRGTVCQGIAAELAAALAGQSPQEPLAQRLVDSLNVALVGPSLAEGGRFATVALRPDTRTLQAQQPEGAGLVLLNRMLLRDAYPGEIATYEEGACEALGGASPGAARLSRINTRWSLLHEANQTLTPDDIKEPTTFLRRIAEGTRPLDRYLCGELDDLLNPDKTKIPQRQALELPLAEQAQWLCALCNQLVGARPWAGEDMLAGIELRQETRRLKSNTEAGMATARLWHRYLLEDAYPGMMVVYEEERALRARQVFLDRYDGAIKTMCVGMAGGRAEAAEEAYLSVRYKFLTGRLAGAAPAKGFFRDYLKQTVRRTVRNAGAENRNLVSLPPTTTEDEGAGMDAFPDPGQSEEVLMRKLDAELTQKMISKAWEQLQARHPLTKPGQMLLTILRDLSAKAAGKELQMTDEDLRKVLIARLGTSLSPEAFRGVKKGLAKNNYLFLRILRDFEAKAAAKGQPVTDEDLREEVNGRLGTSLSPEAFRVRKHRAKKELGKLILNEFRDSAVALNPEDKEIKAALEEIGYWQLCKEVWEEWINGSEEEEEDPEAGEEEK